MPLRGILLYLSASSATRNTNNHDPEIGLEIRPEDTLEPTDDHHNTDDDEVLNETDIGPNDDEAENVEADITEDFPDLNPRRFRRFSSVQTAVTSFSKSLTLMDQPTWFQKVKYFVFPPKEDVESFVPNYRYTPIISGLLIPFCILLEIPGLTQHWYVRTENNQVVQEQANPAILDIGLGISLACAVIANLCLIMRFLEKRVKTMTVLCVAFLIIHGTHCSIFMDRSWFMSNINRSHQYCDRDYFRCRASIPRRLHLRSAFLDDSLLNHCIVFHNCHSHMGPIPNP